MSRFGFADWPLSPTVQALGPEGRGLAPAETNSNIFQPSALFSFPSLCSSRYRCQFCADLLSGAAADAVNTAAPGSKPIIVEEGTAGFASEAVDVIEQQLSLDMSCNDYDHETMKQTLAVSRTTT